MRPAVPGGRTGRARVLGLLLGFVADRALGDPRRGHPVAGFGRVALALEARSYADHRAAGVAHVALLVGGTLAAGAAAERRVRRSWRADRPEVPELAEVALVAVCTWAVLGGRSLEREATAIGGLLAADDLAGARRRVRNLVGRDPELLDAAGVARATVESLAENTSDAVVAPLLWGGVAGVPGLVAYRAVNTLDAMVGHRSPRYARFGWAAARLDDVANLVPARVAAGLAAAAAPRVGGSSGAALAAWRRDAAQHPSPNAGPVEAAFAGALGVSLGGRNTYGGTVEDRGTLGTGPAPRPADVPRAARLALTVDRGALLLAAGLAVGLPHLLAACARGRGRARREAHAA